MAQWGYYFVTSAPISDEEAAPLVMAEFNRFRETDDGAGVSIKGGKLDLFFNVPHELRKLKRVQVFAHGWKWTSHE